MDELYRSSALALVLDDDVEGVDDTRQPTEDGQDDVDEEICTCCVSELPNVT